MKPVFLIALCAMTLAGAALAQSPSVSPVPSATLSSPVASPSASPESELEQSIRHKHKNRFNFVIGKADAEDNETDRGNRHHVDSDDDIPAMVVPLVAVVFLTIFGAPVLIVAVILYFGFSKSRMQHRTIRMMVEKGQPVPAELLAPPAPAVRQRSDMRRGVVLVMIGLGLTLFLGAANEWEGGAWAIGVIPFLIGLGYLLVWKLEKKNSVPPPPPAA